jgi:stage V sporulation protein D (sporulation-specific penicillin-binding protein)
VKATEPEVVRQVISEDTAREVWTILENVVSNGTGKPGQVEGYKVCGKTGTAEKVSSNGGYSARARVVSFAGFAPAENPQIACLVIVDEPTDAHGGSTAGPVFQQIMADTLRYLEVPKDVTISESTPLEEVTVPAMPDDNPMNAIEAVKAAGLTPIVETQGEVLYTFVPAEGTKVQKGGNVYLYCGSADGTQIVMPSLYGHTIKEVDRILAGMGLTATMNGSGLCIGQSIEPGQLVEKGTALFVDFSTSAQSIPSSVETEEATETLAAVPETEETADTVDEQESGEDIASPQQEREPIWD